MKLDILTDAVAQAISMAQNVSTKEDYESALVILNVARDGLDTALGILSDKAPPIIVSFGPPAAAEADPTCIRCWRHRSEHATLANGIFCPSVAGRQMANCTFIGPPAAAEEEGSNEPTNL